MSTLTRRQVLAMLGGGTLVGTSGLSFAAGASAPPKRLLVVSTNHGTSLPHWAMNPWDLSPDGTWERPLADLDETAMSHILRPLHRHRHRLTVTEGVSMPSAEADLPGLRHEKGWIHAWTGDDVYFTADDLFATQPSVDQLVARQIARVDRLPSLELSVGYGRPIAHAGARQTLPQLDDPRQVWQRVFGGMGQDAAAVHQHASVLDVLAGSFSDICDRWGRGRVQQLEQQATLVRALERRFTGMAQLDATPPDASAYPDARGNYDDVLASMTELIAASFACDATRVISLSLGDLPPDRFGWAELARDDVHTHVAHQYYSDPDAFQAMGDYNQVHAQQLAAVLDALEAVQEGDGTLLDNTLVVWGNEMGDGWHGFETYPAVMVGGGWARKTGRYVHLPWGSTDVPLTLPHRASRCGVPHQHWLVDIARTMGVDVDHVGKRSLRSATGQYISLMGGIPGL